MGIIFDADDHVTLVRDPFHSSALCLRHMSDTCELSLSLNFSQFVIKPQITGTSITTLYESLSPILIDAEAVLT